MKFRIIIYLLFLTALITSCSTHNRNRDITEKYFDAIKVEADNAKLTMFCTQMPKGGDLHHHYSGALYVETYLDWANKKYYCLNPKTLMLDTIDGITIDSLKNNGALYRIVLETWSDEDFTDNSHLQEPPDQHFFNTFGYFGGICKAYYSAGLEDIKQEAGKENVQYIETMLNSPKVRVQFRNTLTDSMVNGQTKQDTLQLYRVFNTMAQTVKASPKYDSIIANYLQTVHSYNQGIDDSAFTMRFQAYAVRTQPPATVFATLYACFDAVARDKSSLLVGVNIVAPENNYVSMRDYWLHMQMFRFLKKKFPTVKTAMHAGELTLGMVKPQDLTYHIYDAVFMANANRIGHGVDMPYETHAPELLKKMKADSIPVEINLTSNEFILGIKGNDHPINLYYDAGVPIVISTDDAGVSRDNLTHEYVLLASRYHFSYKQIKSFVFNSIRYSFLKESEKTALEENLKKRFEAFESEIAGEYRKMKEK
jgi:adenosine deaminase